MQLAMFGAVDGVEWLAVDEDGDGDRPGVLHGDFSDSEIGLEIDVFGRFEKEAQLGPLAGPSPGSRFDGVVDVAHDAGVGAAFAEVDEVADSARLADSRGLTLNGGSIRIRNIDAAGKEAAQDYDAERNR